MSKTKGLEKGGETSDSKVNEHNFKTTDYSFEECLKKVEFLSNELESGGLELSEAIEKYKLAVSLMKRANYLLSNVKDELEIIDNQEEKTILRQDILKK
ncbi:MAG: exodeoxyribonuclease VII small subunit [Betaproteobacteria bacterium TMED156]|nr:MAG: exodeoxyribonuclease VII small subunit [Betaproteobacteria bacterium TMED156]|tara:strand:- start:1989 stop:2285 length:297 start_codon:yes stop_codon:yes gene_type:complete